MRGIRFGAYCGYRARSLACLPSVRFGRGGIGFFLVAMILFCLGAGPAHAESRPPEKACNAKNARAITVAEASLRIKQLEQACVRISGITDGWSLYGSLGGIYRSTYGWKDRRREQFYAGRIGLRAFPEVDDDEQEPDSGTWKWSQATPYQVTLIGRLHYCGLDWSHIDPDGTISEMRMATGWCHYNGGGVLRPEAILAEEPATLVRMTGSRARRQFGDIVPVNKPDGFADNALRYVQHMLLAAHEGDRRVLLASHGLARVKLAPDGTISKDNEESAASHAQDLLDVWFGNSDTVISQTARYDKQPVVRLYEPRWPGTDVIDFWACWAAEPLSDRDGPISSLDTGNIAGRPYACLEIFMDSYGSVSFVALNDSKWVFRDGAAASNRP